MGDGIMDDGIIDEIMNDDNPINVDINEDINGDNSELNNGTVSTSEFELTGTLPNPGALTGTLDPIKTLTGTISNEGDISGGISPLGYLSGGIQELHSLTAELSSNDMRLFGSVGKPVTMTGSLSNAALRGYSAYDLAVFGGFEGTEEEWLASLAADNIEVRNNGGVIEYKYSSGSLWTVLIDLSSYTNDYEKLHNKPKIDGTTLIGDRDLSVTYIRNTNVLSNLEIEELLT